jgi:uncharacterized protein (TIGR02147 family)
MPNIFEYLDYRKFLKDYYEERKKSDPGFTHRYIADKLSIDSGYVTKIIQGDRHISTGIADRFAAFLKFGKRETEYFRTMVLFCKAKRHEKKNALFENLISYNKSEKHVLSQEQYALFGKWYNLVIREIIAYYPLKDDYAGLGKMIIPHISPAKAKKSVELLESLHLIRRNQDGFYEKVSPVWTTGEEARSIAVINYQKAVMDITKDAFDRFPQDDRYMSTLTVSISRREYDTIQNDIKALREKILSAASRCGHPDRVYQCNFSVFPIARGQSARGEE